MSWLFWVTLIYWHLTNPVNKPFLASWWRELNPWPLPYQGSALPLSHISIVSDLPLTVEYITRTCLYCQSLFFNFLIFILYRYLSIFDIAPTALWFWFGCAVMHYLWTWVFFPWSGQSLRIRFLPDNIQEPGSPLDLTLLLSPAPDPGHSPGQ